MNVWISVIFVVFNTLLIVQQSTTISYSKSHQPSGAGDKGDLSLLNSERNSPEGKVNLDRKHLIFDDFGHAFEGIRYGLKGVSQSIGANIGYPAGFAYGVLSPRWSAKEAAKRGAKIGSVVVGFPFSYTRPLHKYSQRFVPGRKKFVYVPKILNNLAF